MIKAYRLLRDLPGIPAGTVFVLDPDAEVVVGGKHRSSPLGAMVPAFDAENPVTYNLCVLSYVFANDSSWFVEVENPHVYRYSI